MRPTCRAALLAAAVAAALVAAAPAATAQTYTTVPGTPYASSLTTASFASNGATMGGMGVTAFFTGGGSASGAWGDLGGGIWGVNTSLFTLTHLDTEATGLGCSFTLGNLATSGLQRLVLSGAPGLTVFDINIDPNLGVYGEGTAGSSSGRELSVCDPTGGSINGGSTVTYRNIVSVAGAPAIGDLFEQIDLVMPLTLPAGQSVGLNFDTDNLPLGAVFGPIPPSTSVPEPASVALLAGGLAALGGIVAGRRVARRRRPA